MTETMLVPVSPTPEPGATESPDDAARRPAPQGRDGFVRRLLLDSGYGVTALVLAVPSFSVVLTGLAAGLGTLVVAGVGLAVLLGTAYVARGFAHAERVRLRSMLGLDAPFPAYLRPAPGDGRVRAVLTPLRDAQTWLDVLWSLVALATALFAFVVTVVWWSLVLGGLTYWFWQRYIPFDEDNVGLAELLGLGEGRTPESLLNLAIGVVALVTLPFAVRLAAGTHASVARMLLCSRVEMVGRLVRMEESRESAHRAEAQSLRRLERDIHDGPQQRLIRLGMDLGRARRQVTTDPARAAATIDAALAQTRETVEELRALSRGIAPPLLVDRGLAVAVREMAAGQAIPVDVVVDVPDGLPQAAETAAYFVVAESLTNVAKHSGATRAQVRVEVVDGRLVVTVDDDGRGGAGPAPGRGLHGLRERLDGVDGSLVVASPDGGPTRVRAEVPLG
ncbi:sensor histidine kinase [Nocardioides sp. TF02-7]|uniref:sensor histidine kinase n=1 Tax=Nocardioides sp. TF02-7 TaxID=2917724 RepID=UPI001F064BC7|nr:sensor histidine kinase [Nocardioides sp. TF02-7]UMG93474.1 sensor domain-containing protein [Nocardioides sp. TF02-7]